MCGIAGYVGRASPDVLTAMLRVLKHRGPDDEGMHAEPDVALGMTRLAIIDLAGGRQPMSTEDGGVAVVFNGEIYNHRELRATLEHAGHRFLTRSDTEVLLRSYVAFGEACVDRLDGMFAFAIWDRARRRLLIARDRIGKKPLHYWHRDGLFLFASEIKALLVHPAVNREPDLAAMQHYLAFGYTPAARSIHAGIAKLPAAHVAVVETGRLSVRRYWAPPVGEAVRPGQVSVREAPHLARGMVREAVRSRLVSDVPLGVFLSGGIDSSAIVAAMREVTGGRIATFSIGFPREHRSYDELPLARLVARRFETDHHEEIVEPAVADLLPTVLHHFDEPFADSSALPTFALARATARHVKVALSGIGGDEAFAGYPRHLGVRLSERYARLPRAIRAVPAAAVRLLSDSDASDNWPGRLRRFVTAADRPLPERYVAWTRFFGDADLEGLATAALQRQWATDVEAAHRDAFAGAAHGDPADGAFRTDLATYLPDDLLVMADRMAMAHSLEVRAPFCDARLIALSLAMPPAVKLRHGRLKAVLKAAFADVLPAEVLRQPKHGFMVPLGRWLRTDLRALMSDLLAPDHVRARGLFEPAATQALVHEHLGGARNHADRLWALMMLESWMRETLDRGGDWTLS
jgi:asparagine synthase (glutamine-hydrolysing)